MRKVSDKVKNLPPYLFAKLNERKKELTEQGVDVIDLGIGAPDLPTPDFVINELIRTVQKPENHRYPAYDGNADYKEAVAHFYKQHYNVDLNPETEILALIGSKEGIAHLMQAMLNPGDRVLLPNPGYPVYQTAVQMAGAEVEKFSLTEDYHFTPQFDQMNAITDEVKLMLLNYPGNPTSATVNLNTFLKAVTFAKKHNLIIAHDAAYDLVTFDNYKSPSILQAPNAKDYAIEFGSLSKSFNMTGWRIGYVVGNEKVINSLATLKSNIDTGQFTPIQKAAIKALTSDLSSVKKNNDILQDRMETMHQGLMDMGIKSGKPRGSIFIWAKVPKGLTSSEFAERLLDEAGIIVTPGNAFGSAGEGYFRVAITVAKERIEEVITRMKKLDFQEVYIKE
ncbi:LL-diaminopimelate aminotransferase [Virgibacillus sp. MSJ-26]|uniref:LL-diaminopimelate aminotransferase n=1 Tax=Virgibacillus sp. MSJ-26 TaxID=2841522 RepID=UPI001C11C8BF|nr:LL-diaminopimelate aminotransferase [Virgibacillus sp. MSJ-26]MBU5468191.1 LL-diaminopimelate aminotransferase [Virgibacillus sp. MSJ-26]